MNGKFCIKKKNRKASKHAQRMCEDARNLNVLIFTKS